MTEKELLELKKRIEQARTKKAELVGRRDYLMKELKETWACDSITEAEEKATELEGQINKLQQQISSGLAGIEAQIK